MTFSLDVKNELSVNTPERECCQRALLTSLILGLGEMQPLEPPACILECNSAAAVRLLLRLARRFDCPPMTWEARKSARFHEKTSYVVQLGPAPRLRAFLSRLGIGKSEPHPPAGSSWKHYEYTTVKRRCCQRAFLRGAFLIGGTVGNPTRAYHLEWTSRDAVYLEVLQTLLRELNIPVRALRRKYHTALYLKGSGDIAYALNLLGATQGLLRLEEIRAVKETKNQVHRRVNCETANLDKSTRVAVEQVADIEFLQHLVGLRRLSPGLRAVARARLRYPEASYRELGRGLTPPVSKASVGRRLQGLCKMAARLRSKSLKEAMENGLEARD